VSEESPQSPMMRWMPVVLLVLVGALLMSMLWRSIPVGGEDVTWSELKTLVAEGQIESRFFVWARGIATPQEETPDAPKRYTTARVLADETFVPLLDANAVSYKATPPSGCGEASILILLLPMIGLFIFFTMFSRRDPSSAGAAAFGRSSAKLAPEEGTGITFADVAGVEEAAAELREIVSFLKTPERFTSLGGRPPKGVLLMGPPGTGKTLLARAVAGEAGVPFFSISGSAFVEMFVGVGAARVRDLFKTATEYAPCIIFIDELDAVGKARSGGSVGNDEREQTLNQLLVEMDGFDNRKGIIVMAATNRQETLDSALLRPGRFDRQVSVDRPDLKGRLAILAVHAKKVKVSKDLDMNVIAQLTSGFAGADLANALNEAALLAARRDATSIELEDVQEAIERVVGGLERKSRRLSAPEKRVVAYHECGHAITAAGSPGAMAVQKVSIIPRGVAALGYTWYNPQEDKYLSSKTDLLNQITGLYGGRAAEEIVIGDVTNGASDDIRRATAIARQMVTRFGMSKLGAIEYAGEPNNALGMPQGLAGGASSAGTAEAVESEVRGILERCHNRARQILLDNRVLLEEMTLHLLETEVLEGELMETFLSRVTHADDMAERPITETEEFRL
jgi:cell division protease FtsH